MKNNIKSFLAVACSALLIAPAFAQQVSLPSNNIPDSTGSTPTPVVYPDLSYIGSTLPVNYVRTQIPDVPLESIPVNGGNYIRQTTNYVDGLGRPLQEVAKNAHADGYDLVQAHAYNAQGREQYHYLPYALPVGLSTGKLSRSVSARMHEFYDNLGPDEQPYSQTETDNSPIGRTIKQLAPGKSWVGSGRGVVFDYRDNDTDEVRLWAIGNSANDIPVSSAPYNTSEIFVTKTTDEDGKPSFEYKDKSGRMILKKLFAYDDHQPETSHGGYACTYYVYDKLGRLRYILPPEAIAQRTVAGNTWSIDQSVADGLCFSYFYDQYGRVIEKKIPGKAAEYLVYDKRGRLCLSQDGNLRQQHKWIFTVYDVLDRPITTGLYENLTASRQDIQEYFYNSTTYTYPSLFYYLTNYKNYKQYPSNSTPDAFILAFTYYDDYEETTPLFTYAFDDTQFDNITLPSNGTVEPSALSNHTRNLLTGTKIRVLDPDSPSVNKWLVTVNYYDNKGRLIQTQSQNLKGGLDISSNMFYFQGMLWKNILRHRNPAALTIPGANDAPLDNIVVVKTFECNLASNGGNNQVYRVTQKIGNGVPYDLAYYDYDHLGRTTVKQFPAANVLQEYTIRGFLNHIQVANFNNQTDSVHIFEENLYYDKGFKSKLYNGNIAGITWRKAGSSAPVEAYGYSYDFMNRLNHAEYRRTQIGLANWQNNVYDFTASNITYDQSGNLLSMDQEAPDMQPNGSAMHMDQLAYTYAPHSNRLINVADAIPSTTTQLLPDFKDNPTSYTTEYGYDDNGNLTADSNKHISAIVYNHMNKPDRITVDGKGTITYVYDPAGNRLQKRVNDINTNVTEVYDYIGNFVYKDNVLQYFTNEEGRTRPIAVGDSSQSGNFVTRFVYDYFVKDHLSNVRSTVTAKPMDGIYLARHEIASANIEQMVFDNIPNVREFKPGSTSIEDGMAARLDGADQNRRIGTAIMLKTMPGDRFNISVDAFYEGTYTQQDEVGVDDMIGSLLTALTGGANYDGVPLSELPDNVRTVTEALNYGGLPGQLEDLLANNNNPDAPKAHLNYLFFNDKMEFLPGNSGVVQVPVTPMGWTNISPAIVNSGSSAVVSGQIATQQPGYVIIYIDNQSIGKEVWFDNLMVGHYQGEVTEENHYYPFGLTVQTSQAGNALDQPLKLTTKELEKSFDLNIYDFGARMQDMQLGRWWGVDPLAEKFMHESPYVYAGNNPITLVDIAGKLKFSAATLKKMQNDYPTAFKYLTQTDINKKGNIMELVANKWVRDAMINNTQYANVPYNEYNSKSMILTDGEIKKAFSFKNGPEIQITNSPGGLGEYAHGHNKGDDGTYYTSPIELHERLFKELENADGDKEKTIALTNLVSILINEYMEDFGEDDAIQYDAAGNETGKRYGGAHTQTEIFGGFRPEPGTDYADQAIKMKEETKSDEIFIPTVPK